MNPAGSRQMQVNRIRELSTNDNYLRIINLIIYMSSVAAYFLNHFQQTIRVRGFRQEAVFRRDRQAQTVTMQPGRNGRHKKPRTRRGFLFSGKMARGLLHRNHKLAF